MCIFGLYKWNIGMSVETYIGQYNKWMHGTITSISEENGDVMIVLDPKTDKKNVGFVIVNADDETKIRASSAPIVSLSQTPSKSLLKNNHANRKKSNSHNTATVNSSLPYLKQYYELNANQSNENVYNDLKSIASPKINGQIYDESIVGYITQHREKNQQRQLTKLQKLMAESGGNPELTQKSQSARRYIRSQVTPKIPIEHASMIEDLARGKGMKVFNQS